jgi:hypothetical protein
MGQSVAALKAICHTSCTGCLFLGLTLQNPEGQALARMAEDEAGTEAWHCRAAKAYFTVAGRKRVAICWEIFALNPSGD